MERNNWQGKNGPLLIAEIGGNHEGNFQYAKKLVKLAINTGVDIIKLQLYRGSSLVSPIESIKRNKHFKKFELTRKQHIYIAEMCIAAKVQYLASVWDLDMLKWIDKYLNYYKIGSGDLTAYPIIEQFAKNGKPIILSTGLSNILEIKKSIKFIQNQNLIYKNKKNLAILQCTSTYPTNDNEINLNCIKTLQRETKLTVGYSDHSLGALALRTAYSLGAKVMEFHFTDTRAKKEFRDHKISLTAKETVSLIKDIVRIKASMGSYIKEVTKNEIKSGQLISFRRAIYSDKFLKSGHIIKKNDLVFLRPNHGIDARDFKKILGKKIKRDTKPFQRLLIE